MTGRVWPAGYERVEVRGLDFGNGFRVGRVRLDNAYYVIEHEDGGETRVRASNSIRRPVGGLPRDPSP